MRHKHRTALLLTFMATVMLASSCTHSPDVSAEPTDIPSPTETIQETVPEATVTPTPLPEYREVTLTQVMENTVAEGYIALTGYSAGSYLQDIPCMLGESDARIMLGGDTPIPDGKMLKVKGILGKSENGWTLTAESSETVTEGIGGDWNRLTDMYPAYSGESLESAYKEFDEYTKTVCTWHYMVSTDGTSLTPKQAKDIIANIKEPTFGTYIKSASAGCGELTSIFAEFSESASETGRKALTALEKGKYAYDTAAGRYTHTGGKEYGDIYGAARRKFLEALKEILTLG